jgi:small subunit ribosomal protein S3
MSFRRAIKSGSAGTMRAGAKGIRIEVAGRLTGAEMSRREKELQGSVSLHTIRADIDFAKVDAKTAGAGIVGVKVWIYKGEA